MEQGLVIGGFGVTWLSGLVVAGFILERTKAHFDDTYYFGYYRDDGVIWFQGSCSAEDLVIWRNNFQATVNQLTKIDDIKFMMVIWKEGKESRELLCGKVEVC